MEASASGQLDSRDERERNRQQPKPLRFAARQGQANMSAQLEASEHGAMTAADGTIVLVIQKVHSFKFFARIVLCVERKQ